MTSLPLKDWKRMLTDIRDGDCEKAEVRYLRNGEWRSYHEWKRTDGKIRCVKCKAVSTGN